MTLNVNSINHQQRYFQQIKTEQVRNDRKLEENQNQQIQNQNRQIEVQQTQTQNTGNFDALRFAAVANIYNNTSLSMSQKQSGMSSIKPPNNSSKEKGVTSSDGSTKSQNLFGDSKSAINPSEGLEDNPSFQKLPDELKSRPDIANLMQSTSIDALCNPESAVDELVGKAAMADKAAYMQLNSYSTNPYEKLQEAATLGKVKVLSEGEFKPKVFEMIASCNTDQSDTAAVKLLNMAATNPKAVEGIERLVNNGSINLTKVANQAKQEDPERTAGALGRLLDRGNLNKADQKGAVKILGDIAKESPTSGAGATAAKALTRAVKKQPMEIAKDAALNLREAAQSGNPHALFGLETLMKDTDPNKQMLAVENLGEIAKSGSSASGRAMESIKKSAQDPKTNSKVRNMAVETMGDIANSGGVNSKDAVQTISDIAVNKGNPANGTAFNVIGKMNDSVLGINNQTEKTDNAEKNEKTQAQPYKQKQNPKQQQTNLSDMSTYKKVMSLQKQLNTLNQQPAALLRMFAGQAKSA